jgi:2-dehydro-3-deoxyphosphogluconate aldolase / (4S)-4-hydroxy-2-oxoglutarate aldolase
LYLAMSERFTALQIMQDKPVIPVIVLNDVSHAVPMARALLAGGLRMLEITMRTSSALACMRAITKDVPHAIVGAGTVRSAADAEAAASAGARFFVSPGYTKDVGQACREMRLPLLPGVATSSEIMMAQEDGLKQLKFFPAMQAGGVAMLKAWSGPFADIHFCPTGGVTLENAPQLLALPNVAVVGGTWLTPQDVMERGDWALITKMAKEASMLSR